MNIYGKLTALQNKLKAPKGQYNSFGKYAYRNAEDILESVKPLLAEFGLAMFISDSIEVYDTRTYVKATVTLVNIDKPDEIIINSAFAREEEEKKGMDGSQITGASSSYARKYAMNAMFAIDDTKDSDTTNTHGKDDAKSGTVKKELTRTEMIDVFSSMAKEKQEKAFADYKEQTGKTVKEAKYLTTEFLRNAIK